MKQALLNLPPKDGKSKGEGQKNLDFPEITLPG